MHERTIILGPMGIATALPNWIGTFVLSFAAGALMRPNQSTMA